MNTNPSTLFSLSVSLFYLALFFLVFGQKRRSHTRTAFLFFSGSYFAITFLEFIARLNFNLPVVKIITQLMLVSFILSASSAIYFGYAITNKVFDKVFKSIIAIQLISLSYIFIPNILTFEFNETGGYYYAIPTKITSLILGIATIIPAFYTLFLIITKFFTTKSDREKSILRVILIGFAFSVTWGILILVIIPLFFPHFNVLHRYSALSTLVFLFASYYAINKYLFLTINYEEIETVSQNLFVNLIEGVVIIGKFGGVVQANKAARNIIGEEINAKVLESKIENYSISEVYINKSATITFDNEIIKHIKITQTEIENSDHTQSYGKLLIFTDITNEVNMKVEHEKLEEQVRHADKMRAIGQLAGGVAHDFNNQLAGIIGCADILHDEIRENDFLHEISHDIIEAARRAGSLTDQLLAFARKGKYLSREVDIHEIINDTVTFLKRSIDKRITLTMKLYAKSSIVMGDPYQLHNAFLNIALNARDAMNGDNGEITFITENSIEDNTVNIKIVDNGQGMSVDVQEKIFEPFFTTKDVGQGTGMGLAAVYGIIDNHSGDISFESTVGSGTSFSIILKTVTKNHANVPLSTQKFTEKSNDKKELLNKGNVLIIDDEEIVCKSTSIILKTAGYNVYGFTKPVKALDFLNEHNVDISIIILDLMMPDIDGYQMFDKIKNISPDVKIIISSGYSLDGKTQILLDKGALAFIQKPFTKDEILPYLDNVLV